MDDTRRRRSAFLSRQDVQLILYLDREYPARASQIHAALAALIGASLNIHNIVELCPSGLEQLGIGSDLMDILYEGVHRCRFCH
jgi:hypothetical protein